MLKAIAVLQLAILARLDADLLMTGEIELDESYFGDKRKGKWGRGAAGKTPVFGILERDGIVKVEGIRDVSAQSLLKMTVKTVRRGSIVYTDKFRSDDALMLCGYRYLRVDHGNDLPPVKSTSMAWRVSGAMPRSAWRSFMVSPKNSSPCI